MKALKTLIAVEAQNLGQIGAGTVVEFTPREARKWIPLPKTARPFDQFAEYEVCGDSLEDLGIKDGFLLTCRKNFELSEIRPNKVCIVHVIPTDEQTAKLVSINNDGTITLNGANSEYKAKTYFADEIQILALVVEFRGQI